MKNLVIAGRCTKDAELRTTQNGDKIASFSVAVDDGYGQNKSTLFFDCSWFGKRGEAVQPLLTKGKQVTVAGELSTREYNGKTYLTIRVADVTLQGGGTHDRQQSGGYGGAAGGGSTGGGHADDQYDTDSVPF